MTRRTGLIAGAIVMATTTAALAGCATVPGTGSADSAAVSAYQSTLAASRAEVAATAGKSACTAWRSGYDVRMVATKAMNDYTKSPGSNWNGITPTLDANVAAVATESGKLSGVITTAEPNPSIQALITDYRAKLDAYGSAIKVDQAARGLGDQSWPKTAPAEIALLAATDALTVTCS
ncbi:hypothetical protein [Tsukamurella strandjordii]|uniref:Lipoprotein n=1 Tax=Tsukamurella strandjordii TaxID=147577 RepID=A0AA90NGJ6_9ACTN|nr:hypothetical protein [Tsukamurella strandjordii]MDP0398100.1 hypothetical protein [Tsukamurella strandjordii]